MPLFECTIKKNDMEKQFLVEADNYAEAEKNFIQYAHNNIAGDYELTAINLSHSQLSIANTDKVVNAVDNSPSSRRIGFNPTAIETKTQLHETSPITIYF